MNRASCEEVHVESDAAETAGLHVDAAERRPPYENEGSTPRLYLAAANPAL